MTSRVLVLGTRNRKKAGELVWARLDEKQTHFFDDRSGESLRIRL